MNTAASMPPSFHGDIGALWFTLFAQMLVALLVVEWAWRVVHHMKERPHPLRHPVTMFRMIILLVMLSMAFRGGPDLVLNTRWADLSPHARLSLQTLNNWLDGLALVPFSAAWLLDRLAGGVIVYQLERRPMPVHLFPTWPMLRRPAKIGVGVAFLAAALAYYR